MSRERTLSDSERAVKKNIARVIRPDLVTPEIINVSVQIFELKKKLKYLVKEAQEKKAQS